MNDILEKIIQNKKIEIEKNKSRCSYSSLEKLINNQKNRNFKELLYNSHKMKKNNIIAEIKKGSPSAGIIIDDYSPENIAVEYEKAGIGAISILTDEKFFFGEIDHLSVVSKITNLPIIRKDFIIDEYQIIESKSLGADVILLIASCLSKKKIKYLSNFAKSINLEVILEVHSKDELSNLCDTIDVIGVNNRNLKKFKTDINISVNLATLIPNSFMKISESGISTHNEIKILKKYGYDGFLIGESFMREKDPVLACKNFISKI